MDLYLYPSHAYRVWCLINHKGNFVPLKIILPQILQIAFSTYLHFIFKISLSNTAY